MRNRTLLATVAVTVPFGIAMAYMLMSRLDQPPGGRQAPKPSAPLEIEGRLSVQGVDDLRVAGRRIRLCGIAYTRAPELRQLVLETMQRDFQGTTVACRQVGAGTPCDTRSAPEYQGAPVMQCFDGATDLAQALAERRLLCNVPALSGGRYPSC